MSPLEQLSAEPFFLAGKAGKLFALYYPPAGQAGCRGAVLHAPAFAEEMNKSRQMVARQARSLANSGYGVLIPDYFGTGDSEGDFSEATLEIWHSDLSSACAWLAEKTGKRPVLWGLRFGALLLLDMLYTGKLAAERVLLWQPVISGEQLMTQFLRLRLAAGMTATRDKETTRALRERLCEGKYLEVAGYELAPELVEGIDKMHLQPVPVERVDWLELGSSGGGPLGPAACRVVEKWREQGSLVTEKTLAGAKFWGSQEVCLAPRLLAQTTKLFAQT